MITWFFALLVLFLPGSLGEVNPGLRAVITDKGLDSVCHTATSILEKALPSLHIPDITGRAKIKVKIIKAHIDYAVRNIKLEDLTIPGCSFTPGANGLTLGSSGISVQLTAHVKVEHKHFPHVSASTDIKVDLRDVSFSTTLKVGRDTNGHATLTTSACSGDVGGVHVSFHGSSAWLYKLFDHKFEKEMKNKFYSAFCSKITQELNDKGNKAIESLPLLSKFEDLAIINYTLTQDPAYTNNYMAIFLKGAFQPANQQQVHLPFKPAALPPIQVNGRMLYVWLSDYILNSACYVFQQTGQLQYTITPALLPKGSPIQLNTTSFKSLVPSLFNHYPNMAMQIVLKSTKPPSVHFTQKGGDLVAFGSIGIEVILPNNTRITAFTLELSTEMNLHAQTQSTGRTAITANMTLVSAKFTLGSSNIGNFDVTPMKEALEFALKAIILPAINRHTSKGLVIPTIDGISFVSPQLTFGEGYALVSTDINYKTEMFE